MFLRHLQLGLSQALAAVPVIVVAVAVTTPDVYPLIVIRVAALIVVSLTDIVSLARVVFVETPFTSTGV